MAHITPAILGAIARQARVDAGLTQTQLARKIGASRFWVAEFEHGKSGAELGLALKALRALRLSVTIIAEREKELLDTPDAKARSTPPTINLGWVIDRATAGAGFRWPVSGPTREGANRVPAVHESRHVLETPYLSIEEPSELAEDRNAGAFDRVPTATKFPRVSSVQRRRRT